MSDFLDSLNQFIKKDLVSNAKKLLDNPNNLSENIINFLNKNDINLYDIYDNNKNDDITNNNTIQEENTNVDLYDYSYLFSRMENIENIMIEIKQYLEEDN